MGGEKGNYSPEAWKPKLNPQMPGFESQIHHFTDGMTLNKFPHFPMPQFLHLRSKAPDSNLTPKIVVRTHRTT